MSAFIIACAIFASISVFSMLTVRRTQIYFGAMITSLVLSLVGIFFFRGMIGAILGLIVGCLYTIVDTQMMIHKFECGRVEPFEDARHLFIDLVKITIEIVKIF